MPEPEVPDAPSFLSRKQGMLWQMGYSAALKDCPALTPDPAPKLDELDHDVLADFIAGAMGDINSPPLTAGELADALVAEGWIRA